ncbi:hypothetical protein ACLKA6_003525 [Drosophila palustris]
MLWLAGGVGSCGQQCCQVFAVHCSFPDESAALAFDPQAGSRKYSIQSTNKQQPSVTGSMHPTPTPTAAPILTLAPTAAKQQ